jgi:glycosyltransferase involved in cell wall biosynthesis
MPKVSVVTTTYNCATYIVTTVECVLAQTWRDFEYIVIDDGSTDNTRELLEPYLDRITYIHQENMRYSPARNRGIRAAHGEYLAFLDSDDLWEPTKLEKQVAVLDQHPEVALVHTRTDFIDTQGQPTRFSGMQVFGPEGDQVVIGDPRKELFFGAHVLTPSSAMVRRSMLDAAGAFDETLSYGEDWDVWVRLAQYGSFAYIPEVLSHYRVFGWEKILKRESSEELLVQPLRTIEKARKLWPGDPAEGQALYEQGMAVIYLRAALSSYQLGEGDLGNGYMAKAAAVDPKLSERDRLFTIALDRAKQIQLDQDSYLHALAFIRTMFSNLPASMAHYRNDYREVIGWLYVSGAFDAHWRGDKAGVRSYLSSAVRHCPRCLMNRGVVSIGVRSFLPKKAKTS